MKLYTPFKSALFLLGILCLLIQVNAQAATLYSVVSGSWNANIWSTDPSALSGVTNLRPTAIDDVIIKRGKSVTIDATSTCKSLDVGEGNGLN